MARSGQASGKGLGSRNAGARDDRPRSGSQRSKEVDTLTLDGKDYANALTRLAESTAARLSDFDEKAVFLLEAHSRKGTVTDAISHLESSLQDVDRSHTSNWRAYLYTLLKKFDEGTYKEMKAAGDSPRRRRRRIDSKGDSKDTSSRFPLSSFVLNPGAEAFVPTKPAPLNPNAPEFVPV